MYFSNYIKATDSIADLNGSNRAVVAGGTQGIGAGIALRFALAGASVWIIGRSETRGAEVVEKLKLASQESARRRNLDVQSTKTDHAFLRADLSDVDEITRVSDEVRKRAGSRGIDWLFETQGGPPTGNASDTPKGIDSAFAVQVLSRFGIANSLLESGTIKRAVCIIAAPASGSSKPLPMDDIELKKARKTWGYFGPLKMVKTGQRDSSVTDAYMQYFAEKYPNIAFSHLFPLIVGTKSAANVGFPFPLPQLADLAAYFVPSPEQYAAVPTYLHATEEGRRYLRSGEANLFGVNLKRYDISKNVATREAREAVVNKLKSYGL